MNHDPTRAPAPPDVVAEEGWVPLEPFPRTSTGRSFLSGDPAEDRLRVRYFVRERDQIIVGKIWFGPGAEGPPGCAHGGSIAAVLDEAMGAAAWIAGHPVMAARLTTEFQQMLPLGTDATVEAWIERIDGRKVHTRGRLLRPDGQAFAQAEGLFIKLSSEQIEKFFAHWSGLSEFLTPPV